MRKSIFFLVAFFCFLLVEVSLYAQSIAPKVINTTGGSVSIGNFKMDWNVGEMPLVLTMQNVIVVTNGFLQPFTEKPNETNNDNSFTADEIRISPNPATSFVEVNVLTIQKGTVNLRLYNSAGQLVFQKQFTSNGVGHVEQIDMQSLSSTEYFLHIILDPAPGSISKKGGYKIIKVR